MGKKWEKIITFDRASLKSGFDGADIGDHELQWARDVIFDNKVLESAPGRSVVGTQISAGYPVDGVCRSWDKLGNKILIRALNGAIQRWTGNTWSEVITGLKADVPYDFLNVNDKTAIVNGYDDAREFIPSTNGIRKLGLEPPRFFKKIAYFESDEESIWSLETGVTFNTSVYRIEERDGTTKQSLGFVSPVDTPKTGTLTYTTAQDFSEFSNGISISNDAFFCISILHRTRSYIDSIVITFTTSAGNTYTLTIDGEELDPIDQRNNVWTTILAKKSRFVSLGTPTWASIASFSVTLTGQTDVAEIFIDNCYWKNPPIEATPYRIQIDNFEGSPSSWTLTNGTVVDDALPNHRVEGSKSLAVTRSGTPTNLYKTVSLDLSQFLDGVNTQVSDEICISVFTFNTTYLTSIKMILYTDATHYFHYTWTIASDEIKSSVTDCWNYLRKARTSFTDFGGANWASITKIELEIVSSGALTLNFDNWILEELMATRILAAMEMNESWIFSGIYDDDGKNFCSLPTHHVQGLYSVKTQSAAGTTSYATLTLPSPINLNEFSTGIVSSDQDIISFWVILFLLHNVDNIRIEIDCNTGDFSTDYFWYELSEITLNSLPGGTNWPGTPGYSKTIRIEIKKEDFTRVGDTEDQGWGTIASYRFSLKAKSSGNAPLAFFDDLFMARRRGIKGIYQWGCVFGSSDGIKSAISEWSEQVLIPGTKVILNLLPISADSDCVERRFYRKGGSWGSEARLDFTIFDNTTVAYFTITQDELLGELLDESEIPMGTIRVPMGSKWGPKFKGEYILYRDPSNLRRGYFSLPDNIYGWSELRAYDFESDLLDVFIEDNILFFNTKNGIKSLSVAMSDAIPSDFHETAIIKHSMGPFASCQVDEERAIVSYDGVYIFNGVSPRYISDDVKDYFDPATYTIQDAIVFYRKRHLYISVMRTGGLRKFLDCYLKVDGTVAWRTSDYIVNCFCVAEGIGDNNEIYVGDRRGNVYQFDSGYVSDFEVITRDFPVNPTDPFEEVVLTEIYVMVRSLSVNPGSAQIQFRINQRSEPSITKLFPANGHLSSIYRLYHAQLRGIEDYLKGYKVGLIITPSVSDKHQAIEAIKLVGEIGPVEEIYEVDPFTLQLTDGSDLEPPTSSPPLGYLYLMDLGTPGYVNRIKLDSFTYVDYGAIDPDISYGSMAHDSTYGYVGMGGGYYSSRLYKFRLDTLEIESYLEWPETPDYPSRGVIDASEEYGYFANSDCTPGTPWILKIRLSDMTVVDTLNCPTVLAKAVSGFDVYDIVLDGTHAYVFCVNGEYSTREGRIIKIGLSPLSVEDTTFVMTNCTHSGKLHLFEGHLYCVRNPWWEYPWAESSGYTRICKINPSDWSVIEKTCNNIAYFYLGWASVIDEENGRWYLGSTKASQLYNYPGGHVLKINLNTWQFEEENEYGKPMEGSFLDLGNTGNSNLWLACIDQDYLYFIQRAAGLNPENKIFKVRILNFSLVDVLGDVEGEIPEGTWWNGDGFIASFE